MKQLCDNRIVQCIDGLPLYITQVLALLMTAFYTPDTIPDLENYHMRPMTNEILEINLFGQLPRAENLQSTHDVLNLLVIIAAYMAKIQPLLTYNQGLKIQRDIKTVGPKKNSITADNLEAQLRILTRTDENWLLFQKLMKLIQYIDGSINGPQTNMQGDWEDGTETSQPQHRTKTKRNRAISIVQFFVDQIFWPDLSESIRVSDRQKQRILINFALKHIDNFVP